MHTGTGSKFLWIFSGFLSFFILSGCYDRKEKNISTQPKDIIIPKLLKVTFYLENSESMFGYVNGLTEYVQVISELSSKPDFISNKIVKEFILINGKKPLSINSLGDISSNLNAVLSPVGFRKGNTNSSELNEMLKLAMQSAGNGNISVFISDGIFDINDKLNFNKFLTLQSGVTKANFINKLNKSTNFETLLIKLNSQFTGRYFYASQNKIDNIDQKRPYYIWVFGDSQIVNKYFNEAFITNGLIGQTDYLRFIKLDSPIIPNRIIKGINRKGNFDIERDNFNVIEGAVKDASGNFSFSFAVDLNKLPFSEVYLTNKNNYIISDNSNYEIDSIQKVKQTHIPFLPGKNNLNASHIITLKCKPKTTHIGAINIKLKYILPTWINSSINPEIVNSHLTFGFDKLTSGIAAAYNVYNQNKNLAEFKFQIKP